VRKTDTRPAPEAHSSGIHGSVLHIRITQPVPGVNGMAAEIFLVEDATQLVALARATGLGRLSSRSPPRPAASAASRVTSR
jgi:hypothetical protein